MSRAQGVTLSDIAARTGVSKVTVSYVLNNRQTRVRISDATRERVLATAREMGYHPNALARALTRKRTDTITLVMQSPQVFRGGSGFMTEMMHGVVEAANALNFDLMLHTRSEPDAEAEARALTDGRSDGAILLRDRDDPLAARLSERGHPYVLVFSRSQEVSDAWFVDTDNVYGGRIAAEHLLGLGHRRIGFITGSAHSAAVVDRRAGFVDALRDAGCAPRPEWEARMHYAGDDVAPLLAMMRRPAGERPTALFAWSDDVARRAMNVLRDECGLRVPEDVSVIGFDGTEAVGERGSRPRLTSVAQPIERIATRGVELLAARVNNDDVAGESRQVLFPPALIERDSCCRAPVES